MSDEDKEESNQKAKENTEKHKQMNEILSTKYYEDNKIVSTEKTHL